MNLLGSYKNGNYTVSIFEDGTKIRENDLDFFEADFPESMDIKITNKCDMGCVFCHENSTACGEHGKILDVPFLENLHPYTELAIGGGNPLEHPDLKEFLIRCKELKLIPSMTVNQTHFLSSLDFIKELVDNKLIYGLGISLVNPTDDFIEKVKLFPNAVIHIIAGVVTDHQLEKIANKNLKILLLGYKQFRKGLDLYNRYEKDINQKIGYIRRKLALLLKQFKVVSFDNLAIKQLNVHSLLTEEQWDNFYMGDDGTHTMYVDMVKEQYAVSSTSTHRRYFTDGQLIESMFSDVKQDKIIDTK